MINLNEMTQLDIEQEFDSKKVKDDIQEQIKEYASDITDIYPAIDELMSKYLNGVEYEDIDNVVITLLNVLGNEKAGISLGKDRNGDIKPLAKGMQMINARDIPFNVFVKTLYKDREIQRMFKHEAIDFVMDLAVELDTIFFDIVKRVEMVEDGQFRTLTYCRSELIFESTVSLRARYERFRLPLIEKPINWLENRRGGYHLHQSRCITNMGTTKQPQNVLNVLNKLQSQMYTHTYDVQAEFKFNVNKFLDDGNTEKLANEKANAMLITSSETYEAIADREIYFEWKFDARGRMYSTGYDINLQGNKVKKGALRPVLW